jgi:hypothetical protein
MEQLNTARFQPTGFLILTGAAAIGFVFDIMFLTALFDDSNRFEATGILFILPFAFALAFIQDYGLRVKQGKVEYFNQLKPQELSATNITLFLMTLVLIIISFIIGAMDGIPRGSFIGFVALMGISYLATWGLQFYRGD